MNELMENIDVFPAVDTVETSPFNRLMRFEDYLEAEETAAEKHEFHNGQLHTMPGGTDAHNEISGNVITAVNNALFVKDDDATHVYTSDMKVQIISENKAVYPDGTVVHGAPIYYLGRRSVVMNPTLIVEVLSNSTENYDKSDKFNDYRTLESFREYVLVSQDKPKVEVYFLQNPEEKLWKISTYEGLDKVVDLHSIGCQITMKQIYHRIFKAEAAKEDPSV
jgi:Uma2 family endonuclease